MVGLPGHGMHLRLDALSLLFLALLLPQLLAGAVAGMRGSLLFWLFVLGMATTLVAGDAFTLIFGLGLTSAVSWLLLLRGDAKAATVYAAIVVFALSCLIPAVFLPAGAGAFVLVALGAGALAGLAPVHAWLARAQAGIPAGVAALMSGSMVKIALYVLIRYAFVILAPQAQPWWGGVLIAAGAASVLIGALRAMLEVEMPAMLANATASYAGLIAVALGVALGAKTMGNPALAALGLQAALLCVVAHGLFKPLLFLAAGEVKHTVGTTSLNWLGGLLRGQPRLGGFMLLGAAGMAAVPLGPGFAPAFLLLHALIGAAATGGILARIGFSLVLAVVGLGLALGLGAAVRLVGAGFLGRPRSLHAAAAEDARRGPLLGMALLAVLLLPVSLVPGLVLRGLTPVVQCLAPGAVPLPLAYAPLSLALLAFLIAAAVGFVLHRFGVHGTREAAPWAGGFGRPPIWLPFGDPMTQPSGTGLAQPVARAMLRGREPVAPYSFAPLARLHRRGARWAERLGRASISQQLAFMFAVLMLCLLALGLAEGG